ncbi:MULTISPECIES: phosphoribosylamine--glycine ligase [Gammaproteobacteria]|uniref:phosphoribosylamine--glycine ligase n=1 Tax=Gammaproteobacteria TaxID=1236 RepID=UPI000DCF7A72|nr:MULTISPECIES: phosphoribosylamine--glycine ligase [Gammaproteobacteria]RTE85698.1 phosphoribosylamine--glycine ligase [Aliidiomarina sp. B3213]TCZ90301.1 phosphoribosylamine--glycine ligase [Lysobacter sp. N42]
MKVLIVGGGGREHALAWKAAQSPRVENVFVAPGNAGTATEVGMTNVPIAAEDIAGLLKFAQDEHVELTIVGPEAPLVAGIVDTFQANGLAIFGPTQGASQLEGSKAFCKDFLARHNIPTAAYETFTEIEPAKQYVRANSLPIVIKADGLAAGKGVIIADSLEMADAAIEDMLAGNKFGDAGSRVVVEEFLVGEEASFIAMVDGDRILPFASSQDHKARDNGDKGPNTGGMGAYSPAPVLTDEVSDWVMENIMQPTVDGMRSEGNTYVGFLYAGLMIAPDGSAKVLEYNCRFGDPETQPIMMRLNSDLVTLCFDALAGQLGVTPIEFDKRAAVGVVLAAGGYPESYRKGDVIKGLDNACADEHEKVFHAGTQEKDSNIVTSGGRVLCATALADSVTAAQAKAYEVVNRIDWDDVYFRTDIAHRAIKREAQS